MPAKTRPPARGERRRAGDARKRPGSERKRPLSAFARRVRREANETLEETTKQKDELLAELRKLPTRHLDFEVADLIREDRNRH